MVRADKILISSSDPWYIIMKYAKHTDFQIRKTGCGRAYTYFFNGWKMPRHFSEISIHDGSWRKMARNRYVVKSNP